MKIQLASVLRGAGLQIGWWSNRDRSAGVDGDLITINLRGTCDPWASGSDLVEGKNLKVLASTAVSDGRVLPFSQLDCGAVNGFLSESLETMPGPQREHVYSRALARLLAHEVYHVMAQTTRHMQTGIAKAAVTPRDLISEHFDFDGLLIAKPRESVAPIVQQMDAGR
jgi:hypothetical protein